LNENREKVLGWSDPTLTGSEKTLATVWVTSFGRLKPESRRLLDRLAMLGRADFPRPPFRTPALIPDWLLDTAIPGEAPDYDAREACIGLQDYSLVAWAKGEDDEGFGLHHLVQDLAYRAITEERRHQAQQEALDWVEAALLRRARRAAPVAVGTRIPARPPHGAETLATLRLLAVPVVVSISPIRALDFIRKGDS